MKRLILLLALLLLLPSQALAECAWVVWHETETTPIKSPLRTLRKWELAGVLDTRQECEATLTKIAGTRELRGESGDLLIETLNVQRGPGTLSYKELTTWKGKHVEMERHTWYCLPDTVDPREKEGR